MKDLNFICHHLNFWIVYIFDVFKNGTLENMNYCFRAPRTIDKTKCDAHRLEERNGYLSTWISQHILYD
ncbi:hypothetical protein AQUCO_01000059v1 [Aquilegia coerulea]|uniref:Uncharacterized protein n=1 Tax=Aquilegia coerulea TaxID=218851 RepID=A0A2G5E8P9_AQUCA|nr:hypothetical protein AQUCO_01000059v1 [Aquilegia coerulea]